MFNLFLMKTYENFIAGRFVPAKDTQTLDVTNPATETLISRVPETPLD